jgi:hypothetical protein
MSLQIFNSILNAELKPWLIDIEERALKEMVRQSNKMPVSNMQEVVEKLKLLLQPFNNLQKSIPVSNTNEIQERGYLCNPLEATTILQHYYKALIDAELIRYYNNALSNPFIKDYTLDVPFQIGEKCLKGIAVLCNQANNELIERGFSDQAPYTDITHFTLTYLRNNLTALYFAIQEPYKEHLNTVYNTEKDFCMYCIENTFSITLQKSKTPTEIISIAKSDNKAFSFGFKGDIADLTKLIKVLCVHKNLLDEEVTKPETLIELLTASDINTKTYKIKVGCKTNLFTYIAECLKKTFPKLTFANIDRCNYFFSENDAPIKQSLLSNSKSNNPISKQAKAEIDKIFKENNM